MGWSDYTTETQTAGTTKSNMMRSLILAYNERVFGDIPYFTVNEFPVLPHGYALNNASYFCRDFDSALDYLIPHYAQRSNNDIILYTVNGIYDELGEIRIDSRNPVFRGTRKNQKLWFEQVIRVLNKLVLFSYRNSKVSYKGNIYHGVYNSNSWTLNLANIDIAIANNIIQVAEVPDYLIYHYTYYGIGSYGYDYIAVSSDAVLTINSPEKLKSTVQKIYVKGTVGALGIFNPGTSGFSLGEQWILNGIDVAFDSNGHAEIVLPGEARDNFPKYPDSTHQYTGYQLTIDYSAMLCDFEFIAGS